jgi:mannitol-specific phosphotransferase system IIBC component
MTMFRRNLKNNLKNEIMRDDKFINDMFDLIEVVIDFDNKLYERAMKKRYDQSHKKARIFFELTTKYH